MSRHVIGCAALAAVVVSSMGSVAQGQGPGGKCSAHGGHGSPSTNGISSMSTFEPGQYQRMQIMAQIQAEQARQAMLLAQVAAQVRPTSPYDTIGSPKPWRQLDLIGQPKPGRQLDLIGSPKPWRQLDLIGQPKPWRQLDLIGQPKPWRQLDLIGSPKPGRQLDLIGQPKPTSTTTQTTPALRAAQ